jgi:GNAT superfamily N-acetyltransferase
VQIRKAQPPDAERIAEIHVRTWQAAYRGVVPDAFLDGMSVAAREEVWRRMVDDPAQQILVAEEEARVVGWLDHGPSRDDDAPAGTGEVYAVYIDAGYWRRGAGKLLWEAARGALESAGHQRVTLWVLEENARARCFYETVGFTVDPSGRKTIECGGKALVEIRYRRPLSGG